jgi:hypothetical protein
MLAEASLVDLLATARCTGFVLFYTKAKAMKVERPSGTEPKAGLEPATLRYSVYIVALFRMSFLALKQVCLHRCTD